ncbi:uncharacterized protein CXorf65 homolog [Rana temporaria]|uniref:uncharacterized protein CXorf65 homolog n=1 Tax=Rana temporaria TaxID=8407 RepID=UPI001AAD8AE9|nr:uncharacterized protein CXorf65 homolog [Rana temporaria]
MFIYIIHGDNLRFLVNIQCRVIHLLHLLRGRAHLPHTDVIDLCDENGRLILLFLITNYDDRAEKYLTPGQAYYMCKVEKGEPGTKSEQCYRQITVMLSNPDPTITDFLNVQCMSMEKSRRKLLKTKLSAARK